MEWTELSRTTFENRVFNEEDGTENIYVTAITQVEYSFNGIKVVCDINHFNPQSESDIYNNINSRGLTEELKLNN